jgi:hypothetical protein
MRQAIGLLLLSCVLTLHAAVSPQCVVCQRQIKERVYMFSSPYLPEKASVCSECAQIETTCSICSLPLRGRCTRLADGRLLCDRDAEQCVLTDDGLSEIFGDVKRDLFKMLAGHGALPDKNVSIRLAGRSDLDRLSRMQRFPHDKNATMGLTLTRHKEGQFEHRIYVLNGLRKSRVAAICAHEYAHTWLQQNLPEGRRLTVDTVEGFCELVSYKLMMDRKETVEQKVILDNSYTSGEVHNLVKAEDRYRFYEIVKWMKNGVDDKLDPENHGRVLVRNDRDREASLPVTWQPVKATPVPDTLVLRGISGTPARRFALVNDATLEKGEQAKVRVGNTNMVVRCVEINDASVVLNVVGSTERTELFLKK